MVTVERFVRGEPSSIVEIPVAWELDVFPYFHFGWKPFTPGLRSSREVFELWRAEFDAAHEENGVFTLTCHPEVIGRAPRIKMLEELVMYMQAQPEKKFLTIDAAAADYRRRLTKLPTCLDPTPAA